MAGGQALNIVPPHARMEAQARSLSEARLDEQIEAMCRAMDAAAEHFGGSVEYEVIPFVRAYRLEPGNAALELADQAIRAAGFEPNHVPTGGGSDAHEFNTKGMTTACLGIGLRDPHAVTEFMPHDQLRQLTEVAIQLVLNA